MDKTQEQPPQKKVRVLGLDDVPAPRPRLVSRLELVLLLLCRLPSCLLLLCGWRVMLSVARKRRDAAVRNARAVGDEEAAATPETKKAAAKLAATKKVPRTAAKKATGEEKESLAEAAVKESMQAEQAGIEFLE
mgnify:CR=1 FL=1